MKTNKNTTTIKESLIGLLVAIISTILGGIAIMLMWRWFIATPFNIMEITIPQAIGIDTLLSMINAKLSDYNSKEQLDNITKCYIMIATPLFSLLIGYIVHLFM